MITVEMVNFKGQLIDNFDTEVVPWEGTIIQLPGRHEYKVTEIIFRVSENFSSTVAVVMVEKQ